VVTTLALWGTTAHAQGLYTQHPVVPVAGIATENGPGTLWVNPANMAYDPDPRYGLFYSRGGVDAPSSFGATVGIDGLSLGVHNHARPTGVDVANDWSLDYGTSLKLPERISAGVLLSWRLIDGGPNYVSYDIGLSWRPLSWLGVGGVAQNIGSPEPEAAGPEQFAVPRSGAGLALRPFGQFAVLGLDYSRLFGADPGDRSLDEDHLTATLRLRPLEGAYLRGGVDTLVSEEGVKNVSFGLGLEIYLEGIGGGYVGSTDLTGTGQTVFAGSDEPGESLLRSGRRVPELDLDGAPPYQPRLGLFGGDAHSWLDTLELLRRIEEDPGVRGLVITLDGAGLSLARCRELRDRILMLQSKNKPVLVYLTGSPGNGDYYVASAASRVAMHPATDLDLTGISIEMQHLRGLFDLVGVQPQFVKRADYKTAPETYTELEPTQANLEMTEALVDDLYAILVDGIASGRQADAGVVKGWIDNGPHTAQDALNSKLVDVLVYPDELEKELEQLHKGSVDTGDLYDLPQPHSAWEDPQQIGIIYVEGGIVSGESSRGGLLSGRTAGSKSLVRALEQARTDPRVRAVVMRVDSPGGSSFASDEIWRATQRLQSKGKPLVVSMGSVAASGGYYVAAGASSIWAEPTTLTGSIGVFSGKFSTSELQEKLGVSTTFVARGRNATLHSTSRPWDDIQRQRMQELVDDTYEQFKDRVSQGRELTPEQVEEVARGRVWSGQRAHELGLVDNLGGFQDAIHDARERAELPANRKVGLVTLTGSGDLFQSLAPAITSQMLGPLRRVIRLPQPPEVDLVERVLPALDTLALPVLYPEEQTWMLDPYVLRIK
jgi:protease-4